MNINKKQAVFAVITVFFVIGFLEVVLNLLVLASLKVDKLLDQSCVSAPCVDQKVPDERLGHKPNPAYPGHDSKGFRNPKVPGKADIIALGDSHTYGTHVESEEAWPRQLEYITNEKVYNMAFGGYGPVHSLIMWDEAIALHPKTIIEAFYSGNDLYDSFKIVYYQGQFLELKSIDIQLQESIQKAEESEPIRERLEQMYPIFRWWYKKPLGTTNVASRREPTNAPPNRALSFKRLLLQYSKIYGLLNRAMYELTHSLNRTRINTQNKKIITQHKWEKAKAFAEAHPEFCQVFSIGQFKTIFASDYRLLGLDLKDPRISEGHKISLRAIKRMNELAEERNIRFLVVLVPTKALVFRKYWCNFSMSYQALTENEQRFLKITKDFLEENGIQYVDTLPALRDKLTAGIQPYPVALDGHPNEHGHRAIANVVAEHLQALKK